MSKCGSSIFHILPKLYKFSCVKPENLIPWEISWIGNLASQVQFPVYCLPTPMSPANGGSLIFPLMVHQLASSSIWPAVQSLWRGLPTNPGVTMWCVCGYS